jgi:hypothetical protein
MRKMAQPLEASLDCAANDLNHEDDRAVLQCSEQENTRALADPTGGRAENERLELPRQSLRSAARPFRRAWHRYTEFRVQDEPIYLNSTTRGVVSLNSQLGLSENRHKIRTNELRSALCFMVQTEEPG